MEFGYKRLYIGGKLVDAISTERKEVVCPATNQVVATIAWAGREDALLALDEAQKGFKYWSKLSLGERTKWMTKLRTEILKNEDILRKAVMFEMGKSYEAAWEDIEALINGLEFYPGAMRNMHEEIIPDLENTHRHKLVHQATGVAVAYLAWNFPLLNVGYKLGPALAAGCSIIIKPSDISPLSAYVLGEIMHGIDFPAGVVNFLCGSVEEVAYTMTTSKIPKVLTMIGSSASGRQIIKDSATSVKHVSLELGGNAPFIVCNDADIDLAINIGIALKYGNCGQICVSPNRFLIQQGVYDTFVTKFVEKARNIRVGFGLEAKPDMGPLVTSKDRERILKMVQDDVASGARLLLGGGIPANMEVGNFMEPTVLADMTPAMRCYQEEVFGPVASIMPFDTLDQAIEMGNDTIYGLVSYVFSNHEKTIRRLSEELDFGEVQVNGVKYAIYLPHGGIKESGIGHDCSYLALNDYLVKKRITTAL
ncbi:succinate-semialdehyde dehydrogenase/glutarate-semialdehyde dehydrogenase [Dyadobacter jejuensis]|uniref:Succinate-semialdehyde dehydrogenase/glutarate-semialdehyde dehydrogenase n=1 Tax=Dyadobacter jejuensis TaxID=1082580 RepID=A0A316ADX8_9BACT|nr:NAD-dependent succinate-semialdehyde dehydrogenase [Dyadobacter jejuensis]PWJ55559.1 succinate-semialdehyde dehydrogenase/glutarate-semialdehyde dehydrogenase [Dyadobacter jejuensis]